jgi:hypothetical protein
MENPMVEQKGMGFFYHYANGNWDAAAEATMISIGVFLDDRAMFDRAVCYYMAAPAMGRCRTMSSMTPVSFMKRAAIRGTPNSASVTFPASLKLRGIRAWIFTAHSRSDPSAAQWGQRVNG